MLLVNRWRMQLLFLLSGIAIALIAWTLIGSVLTAVTFKWRGPRVR